MIQIKLYISFLILALISCGGVKENEKPMEKVTEIKKEIKKVFTGADHVDKYLSMLKGKKVGMVVNQTSTIGNSHIVDSLIKRNIEIIKIYAPEHGFRGKADAGEHIDDGVDSKTGLPIISIYGKSKKPSKEQLSGIEIMVFDIQDVGARFYTYLSTLHYVMEACAEQNIPLIVLDRPNPNAHYVDGPVLEKAFKSFVGMHPVPIVYGMSIGEYATMINGEKWLKDGIQSNMTVVKLSNWTHHSLYSLPIKPSPNLPNMNSIYLYPSLCLFEGTIVSVGRGTDQQFQVLGHPDISFGAYEFIPKPNDGAKYPKLEGKKCRGIKFDESKNMYKTDKQIIISYLLKFYNDLNRKDFFLSNNFFNKLVGNSTLMKQIKEGVSENEIRASWQDDLEQFKRIRRKYLMYE